MVLLVKPQCERQAKEAFQGTGVSIACDGSRYLGGAIGDDIKRPRGRPLKRWIDNINDDLKLLNISIKDCFDLAHDKTRWLELIDRCMNLI